MTHAHPTGRAGGVAHATALAHVLRLAPGALPAKTLLDDVLEMRVVRGSELAPKLDLVRRLLEAEVDSAEAARQLGNGVLADEAVPLALFCFLRWCPDFTGIVRNALSGGGDTDTIAAMSGALCGALVGEEGLPSSLLRRLEGGARGVEYVRSLADAVFGMWHQRVLAG